MVWNKLKLFPKIPGGDNGKATTSLLAQRSLVRILVDKWSVSGELTYFEANVLFGILLGNGEHAEDAKTFGFCI